MLSEGDTTVHHCNLQLHAKFDGDLLTILELWQRNVWLTFCGHGVLYSV